MGFRFRKRIKILPGVRLNLSKSGVSTSLGGRGLTVNLKDGKTKTTVGIPGSGLSYSQTAANGTSGTNARSRAPWVLLLLILLAIFGVWIALN